MTKKYLLIEEKDGYISPVQFFDSEEDAHQAMRKRFREVTGYDDDETREYFEDSLKYGTNMDSAVISWWDEGTGIEYGWRVQTIA